MELNKKSMKLKVLSFFFVLMVLVVFHGDRAALSANEDIYKNIKLFNRVLDLIEKNYVEEIDSKTVINGAINGMIKTLDPHSAYMTAEMYKELQVDTKGVFSGLGIVITMQDDVVTVVSPIEDKPAFLAGIKAGDQIIGIDGKSVKGLTIMEAVHKLRGPAGTKVKITVVRKGLEEPKDFEITRAIIEIKSVKYKIYPDNIGYIRMSSFQETTTDELKEAIKEINLKTKKSPKGIVLDLRNNPGGLLDQSIKVSEVFLKSGVIVSTKGRTKNAERVYEARNNGNEPVCPIVILINGGTASASEIVSGALHDNGKAVLVGTKTFGKASMQVVIPLDDGSALKLTTAKYYTPSGELIQAKGIVPDIVIEYDQINEETDKVQAREKDLKGHLEGDNEGADEGAEGFLTDDNQLKCAVDLLNSWEILKKMNRN